MHGLQKVFCGLGSEAGGQVSYFAQQEFAAFVASSVAHVALKWLALSGRPLNQQQRDELTRLLDEFFRKTGHRSFKQHGEEK